MDLELKAKTETHRSTQICSRNNSANVSLGGGGVKLNGEFPNCCTLWGFAPCGFKQYTQN